MEYEQARNRNERHVWGWQRVAYSKTGSVNVYLTEPA